MNPPCLKPTDAEKYRQQYLSSLALSAANNQKNLNANLIFKQTGQSPTQPTDFRTTTEKSADVDGMRREVRSFIASAGFCSSGNANEIAQTLSPEELEFVIQYKLFVSTDFKGRGVPAEVFLQYLRKLKQKMDQSMGVDFGLQQDTGKDIIMGQQQILGSLPNADTFQAIQMALTALRQSGNRNIDRLIEAIDENMEAMGAVIPSREDFQNMARLPTAYQGEIQVMLDRTLANVPTQTFIQYELDALSTAMNERDTRRIQAVLTKLEDVLTMEAATREEGQEIKQLISQGLTELGSGKPAAEATVGGAPVAEAEIVEAPPTPLKGAEEARAQESISAGTWSHYTLAAKKAFLLTQKSQNRFQTDLTDGQINKMKKPQIDALHRQHLRQQRDVPAAGGSGFTALLKGRGLSKAVAKPRVRNHEKAGQIEGTLKKPASYIPFGRYLINKHKINDNILMLHRVGGGAIKDFPTQRVSGNMAVILKNISAGLTPHVDHITGLGLKDQEHLHRILNLSRIEGVPVPTPKTDDKKELDRFDILKGEISAGNDNKTLVKEFKVLLLRFIQRGRIPRREGQEILTDLTAMGF
jgi:hypothetical protein